MQCLSFSKCLAGSHLAMPFSILLATASLMVDARAQSPGWCNEYANQAVVSAAQNRSYGCGFQGKRWIADYQIHYNWCMTVPQPVSLQERLERQRGIKICHSDPG